MANNQMTNLFPCLSCPSSYCSSDSAAASSPSPSQRFRPRSPVVSAPTLHSLQQTPNVDNHNSNARKMTFLSPSFTRAFSQYCCSSSLLLSFLPPLSHYQTSHFLNLTNSFSTTSRIISSLRGQPTLSGGCLHYVSLHFQQLAHAYLHSCVGTFLCLTRSQLFPPPERVVSGDGIERIERMERLERKRIERERRVVSNPHVLMKTFVFLLDVITASLLSELPEQFVSLLFGWQSMGPMELLFKMVIAPTLENLSSLGFEASTEMQKFSASIGSLLRCCTQSGTFDYDALHQYEFDDSVKLLEAIPRLILRKKLTLLAIEMEQPKPFTPPDAYLDFLPLWEANHLPCDESCEGSASSIPLNDSLTIFQDLLQNCHGRVIQKKSDMFCSLSAPTTVKENIEKKDKEEKGRKGKKGISSSTRECEQQVIASLCLNPYRKEGLV